MAGLVLFALLSATGCNREWRLLAAPDAPTHDIVVASLGWHTGLVLKREDLGEELAFLADHFGPFYDRFEIGWGDKGFYEAEEITTGITLRAIFWPTDSVVHVWAMPGPPEQYYPAEDRRVVPLSDEAIRALRTAIVGSFVREDSGEILPTKDGLYGNSRFYTGVGCYYMTNTCNSWTARMLSASGVPIGTTLTLTAGSVMGQVEDALFELDTLRGELDRPPDE